MRRRPGRGGAGPSRPSIAALVTWSVACACTAGPQGGGGGGSGGCEPGCADGFTCSGGTCQAGKANGTACQGPAECESGLCERGTCCSGACPAGDCGPWGDCSYPTTCASTGARSRACTDQTCSPGDCTASSTEESEACVRETEGVPCGGDGQTCSGGSCVCAGGPTESSCADGRDDDCDGLPDCDDPDCAGRCGYPVPPDLRDRVGVYGWAVDSSALAGGTDRLTWIADRAAAVGTRTVRVYLGPADPYQVNPPASQEVGELAASPAYRSLFSRPELSTFLLTAYTAGAAGSSFSDGFTPEEAASETAAIAALGAELLSSHERKTFVLLQWEGDNAIAPFAASDVAWDGFTGWTRARAEGVRQARARHPQSTSRLHVGLEFNRIAGCGPQRCVITDVAPFVEVDYYSYSAWESINVADEALLAARVTADLDRALGWVRAARPAVGPGQFLIGEFGFAREVPFLGECAAARRAVQTIEAVRLWGAAHAIYWQVIDSPPSADPGNPWAGYGWFKAAGGESEVGRAFGDLYRTQLVGYTGPARCPSVNEGGVVNAITYTTDLRPGDAVSVFGTDFSDSGNLVQVWQGTDRYAVGAGSPAWYESPLQINFTLPAGVTAGSTIVYVTRADGLDSNGQVVAVR